jgi:hypothetical protein
MSRAPLREAGIGATGQARHELRAATPNPASIPQRPVTKIEPVIRSTTAVSAIEAPSLTLQGRVQEVVLAQA